MSKKVIIASVCIFGFFLLCILGVLIMVAVMVGGDSSSNLALSENKIALIDINNVITNSEKVNDLIRKAVDSKSIKAIVLRINSPGGAVGASQEIYQEVTTARAEGKIVVCSMGDLGASGAYYIASGSDKIIANPGTLTGSIGVIMSFMNWEGLMTGKLGLKFYTIKSGKFKDTGSPDRPMSDAEKKYIQDVIDNVYLQFTNAVIQGRESRFREIIARQKLSLPPMSFSTQKLKNADLEKEKKLITYDEMTAYLKPYAEGNIYSGEQAYHAGLVDGLGNLNTAIEEAAKMANLPPKSKVTHLKPRDTGMVEKLFGEAGEALSPVKNSHMTLQYIMR